MEKEQQDKLKQKYSKISKKHPKLNFLLLDNVVNFVKEHPKNNLGISVNDISKELNKNNSLIRRYCLKYAIPFGKLNFHKMGNSHQYPVAITIIGKFKSVKNFDLELEESCSSIVDFFDQKPNKLPKKMKKYLDKLKKSLAEGKPNIGVQEKLIKILWDEGIELNCITFRRTNYLFS